MIKYVFSMSYNGANFHGFARQTAPLDTIQGRLETAIKEITGEEAEIFGSGRTDAGVHAICQYAHIELSDGTAAKFQPKKLAAALNGRLPPEIRITGAGFSPQNFHARFSARRKTYLYVIDNGHVPSPLKLNFAAHVGRRLSLPLMRRAARYLVGEHNFKSFCGAGNQSSTFERRIYKIKITGRGNDVKIEVTGSGFLNNMVRIISGTLIDVGLGRIPPKTVAEILAAQNRSKAGPTAPPQGLYLKSVDYLFEFACKEL